MTPSSPSGETITPKAAADALADIDLVVARMRRSRTFRLASGALMLWGPLVFAGYALTQFWPGHAKFIWPVCDAIGLLLNVLLGIREQRNTGRAYEFRVLVVLLLMIGFGLIWSVALGRLGAREMSAFWPTLFMFGYVVFGLFGRAFVLLGLAITALTLAGYAWTGGWFDFYMAVVNGGGLFLCGYWMRRASDGPA